MLKLLWKGRQGLFGHAERTQTVPGKGHCQPTLVQVDGSAHGLRGMHLVEDGSEPRSTAGRAAKGQELVPPSQRRCAGQQNMLYVVECEHCQFTAPWSGMLRAQRPF